jgi:hypothetical protein
VNFFAFSAVKNIFKTEGFAREAGAGKRAKLESDGMRE